MNFKDKLDSYQKKINKQLDELLVHDKPEVLYDPAIYAVNIGGKRLRPIVSEIFYRLFNGENKEVLYPALAIELLHNFTLVHDDIMDNDSLRRGKETVHVKWDLATGILAGDGIIGLAYKTLMKDKFDRFTDIMEIFTDGVVEVCEGQGFDKEFETRNDVTYDEYINMIYKKTAALLVLSCKMGACCANVSDELINLTGEYGKSLGIAFQIQDDYLDICADEKLLGKTYGSDVQEGKKTFLYVKAIELLKGDVLKKYLEIIDKDGATREEILLVKDMYEKYGILDVAKEEIERYVSIARDVIKRIPDTYDKNELIEFTEYLLNRKY